MYRTPGSSPVLCDYVMSVCFTEALRAVKTETECDHCISDCNIVEFEKSVDTMLLIEEKYRYVLMSVLYFCVGFIFPVSTITRLLTHIILQVYIFCFYFCPLCGKIAYDFFTIIFFSNTNISTPSVGSVERVTASVLTCTASWAMPSPT